MNDTTHLYGTADPDNHQAAAENGLRGEAASDAAFPALRHTVSPPGQPSFEVEETSGIAVVAPPIHSVKTGQATAPAGPAPSSSHAASTSDVHSHSAPPPPTVSDAASPWPWIVVTAAVAYMIGRRRGRADAPLVVATPVVRTGAADDLAGTLF
ncbi:hypothetical protein F1C10_14475 [Sphingomonas sp. NBWT7]|uniref:hypothetical protein n=1 Tax=Sphingomonas sp. NBWT7 TaxID=2596913 RepID=UPI001626A18F|nr:hypothetical protein [Sphingomonas sp. NBWT7]QNE33004.1 hypothetical protein F1C10_14475 [Sphingomonas sp. NBWT7]